MLLLGAMMAGAALGLATSVHCAAMCGPIAALSCGKNGKNIALYQLGRIISYGLLGVLAGTLGSTIRQHISVKSAGLMATGMLGIGLAMAAWQMWKTGKPKLIKLGKKDAPPLKTSALAGLGTALLPCGALWAAILVATTRNSLAEGVLLMISFAAVSGIGPVAAGFIAGWISSWQTGRKWLAIVLAIAAGFFIVRTIDGVLQKEPKSCCAGKKHAAVIAPLERPHVTEPKQMPTLRPTQQS